ncbi:factor-independent urate hydroxylase [Silvibacterium sp.]|uniref:factor-independent urate hydroxylase n=1 Tax=Silvibacterium sp. TaxID=1964179 RepID=UPI0039E33EA5
MFRLGANRYGKSRVRLMKLSREFSPHRLFEWTVEIALEGDFETAFTTGSNARILPTDTMKNTVYALARTSSAITMEDFALELGRHLLAASPYAATASISIRSTPWAPIAADGESFADAFTHAGDAFETATVTISPDTTTITSGFTNLSLLKTAKSGFTGFLRDPLTTLRETEDRLFGTLATVEWRYAVEPTDFAATRAAATDALLAAFARHRSLSVQQTLYAMGEAALGAVEEIAFVHLRLPNKHCNLVDLTPFGLDNPNTIFVPTDEPHGSIEATVERA